MNDELMPQTIINNEYDYSNILPTVEAVTYLVQYCDNIYKQFANKVKEDEEKNSQFKDEYKEYMYKKAYTQEFGIAIYGVNSIRGIQCNDYETFVSAIKDGNLNRVGSLKIEACLNFDRGKQSKLEKHENEFIIYFKPYDIKFTRKSNHNDPSMNQIEEQINTILKKFPVANSIFCNKQ